MSRIHSHILTASELLGCYKGEQPFVFHLKNFFSGKKKFGSRDRKTIANMCYAYFRLGNAMLECQVADRIVAGLFLVESKGNEILEVLRPALNGQVQLPVSEKLSILQINRTDVFSFHEQLGTGIDKEKFIASFFRQPDLFLRARPGKMKKVMEGLTAAALPFETENEHCLRIKNSTSLGKAFRINEEAVVQDLNSQAVFDFLEKHKDHVPLASKTTAWDCCAASGGKSILLHDVLKGKLQLTVSDIRENILFNLVKRLGEAGVKVHEKFIADLSKGLPEKNKKLYSVLVCDVPCTGSGTWGRTPEQLFYFKEESIGVYAERQKRIVSNVIPSLAPGGLLFYITCSVFKKENEEVVAYIKENFPLNLLQEEYLPGYNKRADSLFVAVFTAGH